MDIVYPVIAMVALTISVGFAVGVSRIKSARTGEVNPKYFKLLSGYEPPEYIVKIARNYSNLLEMPILFYLVCTLMLVLNISNSYLLNLAWAYFSFRLVHTIIHISYNHPLHRFFVFLLSVLCLVAMWVEFTLIISSKM